MDTKDYEYQRFKKSRKRFLKSLANLKIAVEKADRKSCDPNRPWISSALGSSLLGLFPAIDRSQKVYDQSFKEQFAKVWKEREWLALREAFQKDKKRSRSFENRIREMYYFLTHAELASFEFFDAKDFHQISEELHYARAGKEVCDLLRFQRGTLPHQVPTIFKPPEEENHRSQDALSSHLNGEIFYVFSEFAAFKVDGILSDMQVDVLCTSRASDFLLDRVKMLQDLLTEHEKIMDKIFLTINRDPSF
ncbi:Oidioi.mRNA.OKI2018_I69.PAR.g10187.t1.cds [Oikopleura dioica]|uniref:Oidioi.mRNA.OKI2018_I69.PAR.g10187.t1.cds n=1 Tax=Oikopleura dioica TaxID=34765 RepID=A0ABN7RSC8_OIKDI|nr:Oidioi.mRNA.OKI2018_I69.PAR.g10187.t1.cds [Oikopleura dioica]